MRPPTRRSFLMGVTSLGLGAHAAPLHAHAAAGPVEPPEAPPPVELTLDDGQVTTLQALLKDRVSAVQLMFTSCQATCPIQGALFAGAAKKLGDRNKSAQLLSISIDPERDTPEALRTWLKRFGASPRWRAAQPKKAQLEAVVAFLKSKNPGPDPHTAQVYYFDRKGRLVLRSVDFPPAPEIVRLLEELASKAAK
jgi:protein SCO1